MAVTVTIDRIQVVGPDGITETADPGIGVYTCLRGSDLIPMGGTAPWSQYVGVTVDSMRTSGHPAAAAAAAAGRQLRRLGVGLLSGRG
ncbi:MAG: hypothetical protein GEV28_22070 [Actinophytocola sp.]|uniref:hypothetical protein n=1 Tax=Actinophytocola sp. TaxID=1872138 RepID=UPI0013249752|nr:hypothetical protein [Actinophytocola sp.]MPZ82934.1 hypothetical protein [Actinophytocola sp.]